MGKLQGEVGEHHDDQLHRSDAVGQPFCVVRLRGMVKIRFRPTCGHCVLNPRWRKRPMLYLAIKAVISGGLIAAASEVAKRFPGFGALIASLPLVSVLGMMWLWHDKPDAKNMSAHAGATFWYVLPSLPMFLVIPASPNRGFSFWAALTLGCVLTITLYGLMMWLAPRIGMQL